MYWYLVETPFSGLPCSVFPFQAVFHMYEQGFLKTRVARTQACRTSMFGVRNLYMGPDFLLPGGVNSGEPAVFGKYRTARTRNQSV